MKRFFKIFFLFFLVFLSSILSVVEAISPEDCEIKLGKKELSLPEAQECETIFNKLYQEASGQKTSLQKEVQKFNAAIATTNTRIYTALKQIETLEKEIIALGGKIDQLNTSLNELSQVLIRRIGETYKKGKIEPLTLFLSSDDFSEFANRFKYLRVMQTHDRKIMLQMEKARTNFEDQKNVKEEKQTELEEAKKKLEDQRVILAQQKADKENLLNVTQNNEKRYQQLLSASRSEIEAIQGIIAGKGVEVEVGKVNQGDKIATIITGSSACSTGTHLHFEIREDENVKNPFSYLNNINLINDSGGDPHAGTGNWEWPLNQPIKFNQGFGANTAAIRSKAVWYDFHTGIDINAEDRQIKAVQKGTLYRGSIACGGGTLRYVRLDHDDSNLETFYVHVNY